MSNCLVLSFKGGVIEDTGLVWANANIWQLGSKVAFAQGPMKTKVDPEVYNAFKHQPYPALVDADFVPCVVKDKSGKEVAGMMLAELNYIKPLSYEDFSVLFSGSPSTQQPVPAQPDDPAAKKPAGSSFFGKPAAA